jgi:drug/metabolite transporter (DMT)-like permease
MLFIYAAGFSYAYLSLETGTGALILFAAVQLTMITVAIVRGDRLGLITWGGIILAISGFVYLILPGISTPSILGFLLMSAAGIAWGVYSLLGKNSQNSLSDTTYNFTRTLPILVILLIITHSYFDISTKGILFAVISGALASGIGYVIWYSALRGLSATQAAVVQLTVPILAAIGGVVFMSELVTLRLIISAILILSGVAIVIVNHK